MTVTVATATWNVTRGAGLDALKRCISSVARLGADCEHVIADGASSDGTLACLRQMAAQTPTLRVHSEADCGIYDALNKCLARAQGEFFLVLGADDWLLAADNVRQGLMQARALDFLMGRVELDDGSLSPRKPNGTFCCHQGLLARTDALRRLGGFDTSYKIAADYKLMMLAHANALRIGVTATPFAHFSQTGVSSACRMRRVDEFARAKAEVFGRSGVWPLSVACRLLRAPSASTRALGRKFLLERLLYRKTRTSAGSVRYLFGIPVFRHQQRNAATRASQ